VAYVLARVSFRGKRAAEILVQLPMVLPPVVCGVALLMAFGRRGLLGGHLSALGIEIPFTTTAVVLAQVFMASPFFILAARSGLESVPRPVEEASRTLGASELATFARITLPLTWPALVSGLVLCWGRAVGEFGATIMFAGNMRGTTRTMTLAILTAAQGDLDSALVLSAILLLFALLMFVAAGTILKSPRYGGQAQEAP
jgi:molybdate transport system permease protein